MLQNIYGPAPILTGSITADNYTAAIDMAYVSTLSVQAVLDVTGIGGGALSFQFTNIPNAAGSGASTTIADWFDVQTATAITADGTVTYSVVGPAFRWFRIKMAIASGSTINKYYILARGETNQ